MLYPLLAMQVWKSAQWAQPLGGLGSVPLSGYSCLHVVSATAHRDKLSLRAGPGDYRYSYNHPKYS